MKAPENTPPLYRYVIHLLDPSKPAVYTREIEASYFVEERTLILFKNSSHHPVHAFKSDFVVEVERKDSPRDGG